MRMRMRRKRRRIGMIIVAMIMVMVTTRMGRIIHSIEENGGASPGSVRWRSRSHRPEMRLPRPSTASGVFGGRLEAAAAAAVSGAGLFRRGPRRPAPCGL